jgi:hypothetical protein
MAQLDEKLCSYIMQNFYCEGHNHMASSRKKIKYCLECSGVMALRLLEQDGVKFHGYICVSCAHTVVTLEQMKDYERTKASKEGGS